MDSGKDEDRRALNGMSVVLPRSADRSAAMAAELQRCGARVLTMPLIDFEEPVDCSAVDAALQDLSAGRFGWLVITSDTTVRALKQRAAACGVSLPGMVPAGTRVVAVGDATRSALEAEGLPVHSSPRTEQSGLGVVENMPSPDQVAEDQVAEDQAAQDSSLRVLLPQADIAADTVSRGLSDKGWQVVPVVAYRTVNWPARPEYRLTASLATGDEGPAPRQLAPSDFNRLAGDGGVDAVVLTSPSTAVRLLEVTGPLPANVAVVAIGQATAAKADNLGLRVAAVATEPTPRGIARALMTALGRFAAPAHEESPPNGTEVTP